MFDRKDRDSYGWTMREWREMQARNRAEWLASVKSGSRKRKSR